MKIKFIKERKQLGTVYHFTTLKGITNILLTNEFQGSEANVDKFDKDFIAQGRDREEKFLKSKGIYSVYYFSTTRNKFLYKKNPGIRGSSVRLILDGDKFTFKYPIKPYYYYHDEMVDEPNPKYDQDESEERILLGTKKTIPNAKSYIKEVQIILDIIHDNNELLKLVEILIKKYPDLIKLYYKEKEITLKDYKINILPTIEPYYNVDENDGSFNYRGGPILHELFEKDLPNIEKLNSYEYKVGNGNDIEAIYYFNLEIPEKNIWSVNWKFTDNNKNTSPEAWKQITATSFKILKDFINSRHPKAIHISGNTEVKTKLYKTYANRLKDLLNNEYRVDNKGEFSVVLRAIEESAKSSIKKRMETMNESYNQALKYYKNGDIFSKSKIERNNILKKYNSRKQISELYNIPFETIPLLEAFTPQKAPLMKKFVEYTCNKLNIDEPKINIINSPTYSQKYKSFGGYIPSEQKIKVVVHNRNMADILRTLAHELVHHMQNLNGDELDGNDGSNTENEANSVAGVLMREFGRENPEIFESKKPELFLDKDKFAHPKTFQQYLIENINEISLSKENAVDIDGDLTGGTFKIGDITYEYNIKNIPNPYKDLGLFYNIQFTPSGEITSTPKGGKENYIKILSTMYKIIVDFLEKEKPEYIGLSSLDNNGYKNYHTVYNRLTDNSSKLIPGYFRKDANLQFNSPQGKGRFIVLKRKDNLNEK